MLSFSDGVPHTHGRMVRCALGDSGAVRCGQESRALTHCAVGAYGLGSAARVRPTGSLLVSGQARLQNTLNSTARHGMAHAVLLQDAACAMPCTALHVVRFVCLLAVHCASWLRRRGGGRATQDTVALHSGMVGGRSAERGARSDGGTAEPSYDVCGRSRYLSVSGE